MTDFKRNARLREVYVGGVGMTPFGKHLNRSLGSLATEAAEAAAKDAGVDLSQMEFVAFSNAAEGVLSGQEMIRGQVALKGTGLAGMPMINTENACASGSAAAHLAWLAVASGQAEHAIAIGAEKLLHADKARSFAAIESGTDLSRESDPGLQPEQGSVMMGAYAAEAREYSANVQGLEEALAAVAVKNRCFAHDNPNAQFREVITTGDVQASRPVALPLRLLTCSPLTDGSAAVIFSAGRPYGPRPAVTVAAAHTVSYSPGGSVVTRAAHAAYRATGLSAGDIDVFQLHDACAFAEILQYEQVGIAPPGGGAAAALDGTTGRTGSSPVNTDGGLLSRGHALGATGLAQLGELVHQLRGDAGARQVDNCRTALSVNSGGWMGDDYATAFSTVLTTA